MSGDVRDSKLWAEIKAVLDRRLPPLTVPKVEILPPEPGQDPNLLRGRITNIPPEMFAGRSAGELRAIGVTTIDPKVPDCAVLKKQENGLMAFDWVEIDFILTPNGEAKFPDA